MKIGLGTAAIGRPQYINIKLQQSQIAFDREKFIIKGKNLLTEAYQKGVRHFDTAPGYGIAEQILLEWIKENNPSGITISTKWGYTYVANFDPAAKVHEVKEHTLKNLNKQWAYSSQFLPFLNIYQIHSATIESGVLENKEVLNRLFEIKAKHNIELGLSTSGANQNEIIQKALAISLNGKELFDSFQVTYNLFDQSLFKIKNELINKKIIVKEALANGRVFPNDKFPNYQAAYQGLSRLAIKYQVGIDAIALRFCIDSINPYMVLSGASEEAHLIANLEVSNIELSTTDLNQIRELAVSPAAYWKERKQLEWQ
tara:strand:- start:455 stop:1396 length:942 start_codon:yes stop_codon:yes gene_type:complete